MHSIADRAVWLRKLAHLSVDKARGDPAPHQPLLLLAVCDLAELGFLQDETFLLSGDIAFRFSSYWTVVAYRRSQRPEVRMPFFALRSGGFWTPLDSQDKPATDKRSVTHASLDNGFWQCLNDSEFRRQARLVLVTTYFRPLEQVALSTLLDLELPAPNVLREKLPDFCEAEAKLSGREARFRLTVVPAYEYTCALTRYRLMTVADGAIVDAAHIHKFSDSRNNDPENGIALSKNAHWLFDQGLWTLSDDYRVMVARRRFHETGPLGTLLCEYDGTEILKPKEEKYLPSRIHLAWHRKHHGF